MMSRRAWFSERDLRYLFDGCVLDIDRRELRRGTESVPVEPQVFDLLVHLIRNRARVVSKDDLLASIWHGRIVSESTLNTRISAARSAIGDNGDDQRLIKTLPRKGIRFVGVVQEEQEPAHAIPERVLAAAETQIGDPATYTAALRRSDHLLLQAVQTKILVIDDHALFREALRGVVKELKPEAVILEAPHARDGMRLAAENGEVGLVLLDLGLPDGDGFELLAELRERHPTFPVVVISGHHDCANVVRAFDLGALGFIPKTTERSILISALRLVFAGGIYIPPEILDQRPPVAPLPPVAPPPANPIRPASKPATSPRDLGLTDRQVEVLALMMQGKSNEAIGRSLDLAEPTVQSHVAAILKAFNVSNPVEAAIAAVELGWDLATVARS